MEFVNVPELLDKCVETWLDAIEIGNWEEKGIYNLGLAHPYLRDDCPETNIEHTRTVIRLCRDAYKELIYDSMGFMPINYTYLLAAASLHDVGKLLEYDYIDGVRTVNLDPNRKNHVEYGYELAKKHGVPDEICDLILYHSHRESPKITGEVMEAELTILIAADSMAASIYNACFKK